MPDIVEERRRDQGVGYAGLPCQRRGLQRVLQVGDVLAEVGIAPFFREKTHHFIGNIGHRVPRQRLSRMR